MKKFFKWATIASVIGLVLTSINETKEKPNSNPNT
jgi:hypothetical protein